MSKPYVYQSHPKWITLPDGTRTIAQHEAHEAELLAAAQPPAPSEKDTLRQEAAAVGIDVDGRWSVERLRAEIAAAQPEAPAWQ